MEKKKSGTSAAAAGGAGMSGKFRKEIVNLAAWLREFCADLQERTDITPDMETSLIAMAMAKLWTQLNMLLDKAATTPWDVYFLAQGAYAECAALARMHAVTVGGEPPAFDAEAPEKSMTALVSALKKILTQYNGDNIIGVVAEKHGDMEVFRLPGAATRKNSAVVVVINESTPVERLHHDGRLLIGEPDYVSRAVKQSLRGIAVRQCPRPRGLPALPGEQYVMVDTASSLWQMALRTMTLGVALFTNNGGGSKVFVIPGA